MTSRWEVVEFQEIVGITSYAYDAQSQNILIINPLKETTEIKANDSEVVAASCSLNHANPGMIWDVNSRETLIQNISAAGIAQAVFSNAYNSAAIIERLYENRA